ncbi:hypothetical protein [Dyadobacter frigoris]|uniref:Uncharacterized protein n=1 Tax=Dyadobacter frigoris TaxID=2576211 RepID=A0A4U6CW16_9BACT|nr:hypothetical protein [Dyadobacter frigoris]TKT88486.1 hypothetical protein FDK13_26380 [Dyadobacter frigoris]GLU54527.1 hypothetical protein Dfri01_39880 [Dyadobacter frigoris]
MITKRKDSDVLDTGKPILEPPVYPNFPENTPEGRMPKDDPDLLRKSDDDDIDDITDEIEDAPLDSLEDDDEDEW